MIKEKKGLLVIFIKFKIIYLLAALLICMNMGAWFTEKSGMANASRPRNPERAMEAVTCRQALQRLREAAMGNPLIDKVQNQKHLMDALNQAERLCLDDRSDKNLPHEQQ